MPATTLPRLSSLRATRWPTLLRLKPSSAVCNPIPTSRINATQLVVWRLGPVPDSAAPKIDPAFFVFRMLPTHRRTSLERSLLRPCATPATKFLPFVVAPGQGLCVHPMPHPDTHRAGARSTPHPASAPAYLPQCHLCPTRQAPCLPARTRDQPQREGVHPPTPLVLQPTSCGQATSGYPAALHPYAHTLAPAHPCAECCTPTTAPRT